MSYKDIVSGLRAHSVQTRMDNFTEMRLYAGRLDVYKRSHFYKQPVLPAALLTEFSTYSLK